MKYLALAAVASLVSCAPPARETPVPAGYRLRFSYTFDHIDTTLWSLSTHTFDGNAAQFSPRNAAIHHGHLELTLKSERLGERHYSGAELQARESLGPFTYGRYEVRMRAAKGNAVISSFFGYATPPWQEIDIEFLGDHPRAVQANVYNSPDANPTLVPPFPILTALPFDATADFHTYAYEWSPTEIRWYADTILIARTTNRSQVPTKAIRPMFNLWLSTNASWAGPIDASALPVHSEYQWVRVYTRL
jgi:endo-1,3-1,4-beta-glycanase ExoK